MKSARIHWKDDFVPRSEQFDDIYFSVEGGLAETKHVFLDGNHLSSRIPDLKKLRILELGFGTGLNFLATWKLWKELRPKDANLQFFSIEAFPLSSADLNKALEQFPELEKESKLLTSSYQLLHQGFNRFFWPEERVYLTLMVGECADMLSELSGYFDAFYLDGFAPSKNPEMWTDKVFGEIQRVSHSESTISTYTVSKIVREGLQSAGFLVEKQKGFGKKREMLTGRSLSQKKSQAQPDLATVIGGGLAGCAQSIHLALRGVQVQLLERESEIASASSGIPLFVCHPLLSKKPTTASLFSIRSFSLMRRWIGGFENLFLESGTFQTLNELWTRERLESGIENLSLSEEFAVMMDSSISGQFTGIPDSKEGVYFPNGFVTNGKELCDRWLSYKKDKISIRLNTELQKTESGWAIFENDAMNAIGGKETLVFCNSWGSKELFGDQFPLTKVRGQIIFLAKEEQIPEQKSVFLYDHYLTPIWNDEQVLGSTFDEFSEETKPRQSDTNSLLESLEAALPDFQKSESDHKARVGFRCQSQDRLPLLGRLKLTDEKEQNLYMNLAYGSRGVQNSLLAGDILASLICNDPLPIEKSLIESLSPMRFQKRKERRENASRETRANA